MNSNALLRVVALAALVATTISVRCSHAGSWSPSLRVAGGMGTWEVADPTYRMGLAGHVVREGAYVRAGLEGAWWEQLGHIGLTSIDFTGVYPNSVRFTNFLMGAIVQYAPAGRGTPVYLVLGVADLVVVENYEYPDAHTRSEWGHAPAVSGGFGFQARDGHGPILEARWYRRRPKPESSDVPNRYFLVSAGVRF
jgi:hypothetical protein